MPRAALLCLLWTLAMANGAPGQTPMDVDPGRPERTREDLTQLLEFYEQVQVSPAYSSAVRESARLNAERIRIRLRDGDFRLGDRIVLYVEGEPEIPDTVAVQSGPLITLPLFGDLSLVGVLRSEIQAHVTEALSRFIRDPVVRAQGLMRVSIQGAVGLPGFYVVPADMLLGEAIMVAGGLGPASNLDELRVERGSMVLLDGEEAQRALREGLTLDQLNLQAGDQIMMPERGSGFMGNIGIIAGILGSLTLLIFQLTN